MSSVSTHRDHTWRSICGRNDLEFGSVRFAKHSSFRKLVRQMNTYSAETFQGARRQNLEENLALVVYVFMNLMFLRICTLFP